MVTILAHFGSGMTMGQVAREMYIGYSNVANTLQTIKEITGGRTIAACVLRAHAMGYLTHPTGPEQSVFPDIAFTV